MKDFLKIISKPLKVGWKEYKVSIEKEKLLNTDGRECYGITSYDNLTVKLSANNSDDQMRATLIHEVLHDIDEMYSLGFNEKTITRLADAIYTTLKDNNLVIKKEG